MIAVIEEVRKCKEQFEKVNNNNLAQACQAYVPRVKFGPSVDCIRPN